MPFAGAEELPQNASLLPVCDMQVNRAAQPIREAPRNGTETENDDEWQVKFGFRPGAKAFLKAINLSKFYAGRPGIANYCKVISLLRLVRSANQILSQ